MQFLFEFFDRTNIVDFWWKNADVKGSQGACYVIYIF